MSNSKLRKTLLAFVLSICIGVLPVTVHAQTTATENSINEGIASLDYNKYEILASQGDTIENVVPKEGLHEDGKFIVLEHEKKSLGSSPIDISIVDSIIDRTYPGALLLANSDFVKNRPTALMAERNPLNISIDLKGLTNNTITVDSPSYGNVSAAITQLINNWSNENSQTHTLPARTQYSETMVYSKNQLKMGLNIDINVADQLLGIDFNAITKGEEKYMVAAYKQIFYTVSAQLPNNPSDLFSPTVTFQELSNKGVSHDSPPVMVSNVAYGRTVYVVLKTSSTSNMVEAAFRALIKGQTIEANTEFHNIIENSSFSVVVLGGDAEQHNQLITTDFEEIRRIIKENARFGIDNPGYPISYTSTFLKDNSLAAVHNSTDYIETTATEYRKGKILLDHSGAYVAQFAVSWDEVSYDHEGKEILSHKVWDGSYKDRTAHYSTIINLKPNTKHIKVLARECTGLAWEWWRTVVDEVNMPLSDNIKISIWGTTLYPAIKVEY